jgi:IMP dehydrogenase
MQKYLKDIALTFDDILLVPQSSSIPSRKEIGLSMHGYDLPIVSSPMDTVSEHLMVSAISNLGGLGILHRYMDPSKQIEELKLALQLTKMPKGVGVAISSKDAYDSLYIENILSTGCTMICIDTANGHSTAPIEAVKEIKTRYPNMRVMVGNVATKEGYKALALAGADMIRVGIGGGSVCTTRIVTGHGLPTLQSILDCKAVKEELNLTSLIVADGGIRNSGDLVKAFAAGADLVMLGSMLAGTDQSPGTVINGFKSYRGMASKEAQKDWRDTVSVEEGISTTVAYKGDLRDVIEQIVKGLQSGCSYTGVNNLKELHQSALYVLASPSSVRESYPHGKLG